MAQSKAPLSRTLLLGSALLTAIPIATMGILGYRGAADSVVSATELELRRAATERAGRVRRWLDERKEGIDHLVHTKCVLTRCTVNIDSRVAPMQVACTVLDCFEGAYGTFRSVTMFDESWMSMGTRGVEASLSSFDVSGMKSLCETDAGRHHLRTEGPDGEPLMQFGIRVADAEGATVGYILAEHDLEAPMRELLASDIPQGLTESAFLWTAEGKRLGATEELESERVGACLAGLERGGGSTSDFDEGKIVTGYEWLPAMNAWLVVQRPAKEALASLEALSRRALLFGVFTFGAIAFFALHLTRRVTRPLEVLAGVANRIAHGECEARVPPLSGREVGQVGGALNGMLDSLQRERRQWAHRRSLAAIGELCTSVVHEMRNPLSSIKLNLQALKGRVQGDPTYSELASIGEEQARRVERMLGDLMSYGKPLELEEETIDLVRSARAVVHASASLASQRSVEVDIDEALSGTTWRGDRDRFEQALLNLVHNAIQASEPGSRVRLVLRTQGAAILVEVVDEGEGLPAARDRLFSPFFTTRAEGTGLGLANAKKILDAMGASIEAHDGERGGTVFRIRLPREEMAGSLS